MYATCVGAAACSPPHLTSAASPGGLGRRSYFTNPKFANHPVTDIDWNQARDYCRWVGRRLPTEAEWEKAARGVDGRKYPWGKPNPTCDVANHGACGGETVEVTWGDLGASPYGALNMSGNVREWVASLHLPYPYDPMDGREDPERAR